MTDICFYFQVHQPYRMVRYSVFDIGKHATYFDEKKNSQIMKKVAKKCYIPMNRLLLSLLKNHSGFRISFSISGVALDQFEKYSPGVLDLFKDLADTGKVEFLAETYHHSLSFIFDRKEFREQVRLHTKKIKSLFNKTPTVFRNTELIYNNKLAKEIESLGFKAVLAEGADHILRWRSPNYIYRPKGVRNLKLLLKNYKLSDDIAFRFSNKGWEGYPLTAPKYAEWLDGMKGDTINLFMDYETFGEHQWEDTGIFDFMRHLPEELKKRNISFHTPSELTNKKPVAELDIHHPISWADTERDLSAWLGNRMQKSAVDKLYALKKSVFATKDEFLINLWRKLTTSDHFYYMCTKWFNDGDVHKYFNPYDSPYEAYMAFMNILQDIEYRIG